MVAANAVHMFFCPPVKVTVRNVQNCTTSIPIWLRKQPLFLDPVTHVIKEFSPIIPCSSTAPQMFLLQDRWYCSYPFLTPCPEPTKIKPEQIDFKSDNVQEDLNAMGRGVMTIEQAAANKEFIAFQDILDTSVYQNAANMMHNFRHGRLDTGISKGDLNYIRNYVGWTFFPYVWIGGEWAVRTIAIVMFCAMFFCLVGCVVRFVALYKQRGFGCWLLAAFWGTAFAIAWFPIYLIANAANIGPAIQQFDDMVDGKDPIKAMFGKRLRVSYSLSIQLLLLINIFSSKIKRRSPESRSQNRTTTRKRNPRLSPSSSRSEKQTYRYRLPCRR